MNRAVTAAEREDYERDGVVCLRGIFPFEWIGFLAAAAEEAKLADLNAELSHLGFTSEFRDPLYKEFVTEMASVRQSDPDLWGQVLTPVQRDRRARLVQGAVQRLRANRERE